MTQHESFKSPDHQKENAKTSGRAPSRFSNALNTLRKAARTSPLLVGLLGAGAGAVGAAGCSSVNVEGSPASTTEGCSPVPDCPDIHVNIFGSTDDKYNFYNETGRWERIDPTTGEIHKVCEPTHRNFCVEGQTPQADGCEPPVCENVQACDPIPTRKSWNDGYIYLDRGNFPVNPVPSTYIWLSESDPITFPVIFDNVPDCLPGEKPVDGDSYYTCDAIPTCAKTIPYCRELPRCAPNQSPVLCEENGENFTYHDDCTARMEDYGYFFSKYQLDLNGQTESLCKYEFNPAVNENVYHAPGMTVQCIPTPECQAGEEPQDSTLNTTVDCGKWGTFQSSFSIAASCDPIKSCK